jgi:glycosyltransferase 2 family protein
MPTKIKLKPRVSILKVLLPTMVGLLLCVLIYMQLTDDEKNELFSAMLSANYGWLGLSMALGILSHLSRAYRWKFLLEPLGKAPALKNSFYAVMIGYLINMILPRAGEASRGIALSRSENISFERTFGTILAERVVDMVVLMLIVAATFYLQFELLKEYLDTLQSGLVAKFTGFFWIVVVLGIATVYLLFRFGRRSKNKIIRKVYLIGLGVISGLKTIATMQKKGYFILHTILIWGLYIGMAWVCYFTLAETSQVSAAGVFAAFVLGSFAIVLFPGGLGAYPVAVQKALILYGISAGVGFALGWIMWFGQTFMIVILGLISLYLTPSFKSQKKQNG